MSGNYEGEERRAENRDINFLLGKIVSRLTAIESNLETKVSGVCEDVQELKESDDKKHRSIEIKIGQWIKGELEKISMKLDQLATWNQSVNLSLQKLDKRIDDQDARIKKLEDAGKDRVYSIWQQIGNKVLWIVLGVIGAAVLFSMLNPTFWQTLLTR